MVGYGLIGVTSLENLVRFDLVGVTKSRSLVGFVVVGFNLVGVTKWKIPCSRAILGLMELLFFIVDFYVVSSYKTLETNLPIGLNGFSGTHRNHHLKDF